MSEVLKDIRLIEGDWEHRLRYIVDTMRNVSVHQDPQEMVASYGRWMRDLVPDIRRLSISRRGVEPPRYVMARDSAVEGQPNPWTERHRLPVLSGGVLGDLLYGNRAWFDPDYEVSPDDPAARWLTGYRCLAALPVFDAGEAMNLVVLMGREPYSIDPETLPQLAWTTNLFGRATNSLVLRNEARAAHAALDKEMRTIAEIQRSLLPAELPTIETLQLAAYYRPAARAGGDYYDFLRMCEGRWAILIADVAGHGSPAAVHMAITHTLAHTHAGECADARSLMTYLNSRLTRRYTQETGVFVTAFAGVYDPDTRRLTYSSAGHNPPRVKRCSDGTMFTLDGARGLPLGIMADAAYEQTAVRLIPGDQVVFYTDGITEARDESGGMFGAERLDEVLSVCGLDAERLIADVVGRLGEFTGDAEQEDDHTLVVALVR